MFSLNHFQRLNYSSFYGLYKSLSPFRFPHSHVQRHGGCSRFTNWFMMCDLIWTAFRVHHYLHSYYLWLPNGDLICEILDVITITNNFERKEGWETWGSMRFAHWCWLMRNSRELRNSKTQIIFIYFDLFFFLSYSSIISTSFSGKFSRSFIMSLIIGAQERDCYNHS